MPRRKNTHTPIKKTEKDCWHLYSLQALDPSRFVKVVQRVMTGRYRLISTRLNHFPG